MTKNLRLPTKYESYQQGIMKSASPQKIFQHPPARPVRVSDPVIASARAQCAARNPSEKRI